MIIVLKKHWRGHEKPPGKGPVVDTTSHSGEWRGLSPFLLGPVKVFDEDSSVLLAQNVENAWQFAKVYLEHDDDGKPSIDYWRWARKGWRDKKAHRYPMGKGAKPRYSWWDGERLGYVEARKRIYCPLYATAVENTDAYRRLKALHERTKENGTDLHLVDFDGYQHRKLSMSLSDVLDCPTRKMGHAFVLMMMLLNKRLWEKEV